LSINFIVERWWLLALKDKACLETVNFEKKLAIGAKGR
jgi:hypothetical protein